MLGRLLECCCKCEGYDDFRKLGGRQDRNLSWNEGWKVECCTLIECMVIIKRCIFLDI